MRATIVAALFLTACAGGMASRPYDSADPSANLEGVYAAVEGGGILSIIPGETDTGYAFEGRLGYSFGPELAVYLSAALDTASQTPGGTYRVGQVSAFAQHHFIVGQLVSFYARAGLGVGLSRDFTADHTMAGGLAETGGLGFEVAITPGFYLTPEFFYRHAELRGDVNVHAVGLQLGVAYY